IAVVARSLSHALSPISRTVERGVREVLATMGTPEDHPEVIADLLCEEVRHWPERTWLVIDEYEHVAPYPRSTALIERFVTGSRVRVVVTSRERPAWIKPRDVLYGKAFELTRAALSLSDQEAHQVLEHTPNASAELVSLADGWPAVIGLSAMLPSGTEGPTP